MKAFMASLLGTLAGLALFVAGSTIILIILVVALSRIEKPAPTLEKGSYLVLDLTGANLTDEPPPAESSPLDAWLRSGPEPLGLRASIEALKAAAGDARIAGVFVTGRLSPDEFGSGFAALGELRAALAAFKEAGKPVRAWFDSAGTTEIYLASAADDLAVDPYGLVELPGLASEPMFFAGALEKLGVNVQVTRSGKYKSAVEPYIRQDLSPESRQQLQELLDDIWDIVRDEVSAARGLAAADLQALVDNEGLITPQIAEEAGLITRAAYRDEVLAELQEATGQEGLDAFLQIDLRDYAALTAKSDTFRHARADKVAIVYLEGVIVDGEGEENEIGGDRFSRELRALRLDEDIAAIVVRVNSPGGSATASEHIRRELELAAEAKPVAVSLGTYAASGGYWVATAGERIFTDAATVTGSIGVFGLQMDVAALGGKVGVSWDRVKTGAFADTMTLARPKTPAEMALFQRFVDWTYDEFLRHVSEARGLEVAQVHAIAQGRVWSGAEAVRIGLADELGGLEPAIAWAAERAGVSADRPALYEYPAAPTFAETLADLFASGRPPQARAGMAGRLIEEVQDGVRAIDQFNDARGVYARLPLDVRVR